MNILYILLKNGTRLISQVEQITTVDIGDPDCKLSNPFVISIVPGISLSEFGYNLTAWELNYTNDSSFIIRSDDILIMQKPKSELVKKYLKLLSDMINSDVVVVDNKEKSNSSNEVLD